MLGMVLVCNHAGLRRPLPHKFLLSPAPSAIHGHARPALPSGVTLPATAPAAAQAVASVEARRGYQSQALEALFELFFRVLKACTASGLISQRDGAYPLFGGGVYAGAGGRLPRGAGRRHLPPMHGMKGVLASFAATSSVRTSPAQPSL